MKKTSLQMKSISGFTLLELLVVVVIIGLLAAYVGPKYFSQLGKSERQTARAQIESFSRAIDAYRLDVGSYPSTEKGLSALITRPGDDPKWLGPYLQKAVPLDPWGHSYLYRLSADLQSYELLSLGKDGQPGGEGDNADVSFN